MHIVQSFKQARGILALLAISLITLVACGMSAPSVSTTTSAPAAAPLVTVGPLPAPIMAANISDNLPTYTCAADAFASYYTLQAIQQNGLDVAHGFHLGIVPFLLDNKAEYDINEDQRMAALATGKWDCLLTTLDAVALHGEAGQITAIVDESAGADQLWVRDPIKTLNDLRGQKIVATGGSVGEFFANYVLSVAGITLDPQTGATLITVDSVPDAVKSFNDKQANAVSAWEPDVQNAAEGGGRKLVGTDTLRVIVDVIVTSRQSIAARPDVVQSFHDAWFDALKLSAEDFDKYASSIAAWGHNDWSFVSTTNASSDLAGALDLIAQAPLVANKIAMQDTSLIQTRIEQARRVWAAAGRTPSDTSSSVIEPKFVLAAANKQALQTDKPVHNASFYMTARPVFEALSQEEADKAQTLAILPCRTFEFLPGDFTLTEEAKQILRECAVPILSSSPDIYLTVLGSAAWPPDATEQSTLDFAMNRAKSVANYLVAQGITKERLILKATLPPPERRSIGDEREEDRKKDRFVQLTLILTGR
jgi:ABC-type nitrate/sulfonate/bicarbonate transport system substrate-binding protein